MARRRRAPVAAEHGAVALALPREIRTILGALVSEVAELLGPVPDDPVAAALDTAPVERPEDPSLLRLLPDGYAADVDGGRAAAELRRLTDGDLRAAKRADARRVLETLDDPMLTPADGEAWARAINDVRLVLGTRLQLDHDGDAEQRRAAADERGTVDPLLEVYELLAYLQTLLVDVLDEIAPAGHP